VAAKKGNYKIVELLLIHGANPWTQDSQNNTLLHLAAESGNLDLVHLAVSALAGHPNKKGATPLSLGRSNEEIDKYLSSWNTL
jgi:ankyrin repeat protein